MFRLRSCYSLYFNDIIHLVAPWFTLFWAGFSRNGSTFGSKPSTNLRRGIPSRHCRSFGRSRATEGQDSRSFRLPNAAIGFPLGLWRNHSPLFTSREGKTLGLSAGSP